MTYETSITFDLNGAEILPFPAFPVSAEESASLLSQNADVQARMLAYLKALPAAPSSINDAVGGLFEEIIAGQGGDFILEVGPSSIFARHKDFSYPGPGAPYTGDVHSGLLLTANGIAMGYNDPSDGEFIPAIAISSTGDISILGTLTAGSVIATTVTFGSGGPSAGTVASDASTGASHAGITNSNPHGTSLEQIAGDLDDIADGSTYFRANANELAGATRAYNALDSGYNYIRGISTQKIIVTESNPTNGVVFDTNGIRGYAGSSLKFNINTSGTVWFAGDISGATGTFSGNVTTAGWLTATGSSIFGAAVTGQPTGSGHGVIGKATSGYGVWGESNSQGIRGIGLGFGTGGYFEGATGVTTRSSAGAGGVALSIPVGYITRPYDTNGRITVYDQTTGTPVGTYRYSFHT